MSSNVMIAVIGGGGKSGKFLVRELINRNIRFRLLLRNVSSYHLPFGHPVHGDVRDPAAVRKRSIFMIMASEMR